MKEAIGLIALGLATAFVIGMAVSRAVDKQIEKECQDCEAKHEWCQGYWKHHELCEYSKKTTPNQEQENPDDEEPRQIPFTNQKPTKKSNLTTRKKRLKSLGKIGGAEMKITEIRLNKNNPRLIKDDKFRKLMDSLKKFPKMMELRPIVVDNDGVILGGNMRYRALKELGYKEIPDNWVIRADELTEEQKKEFIIKDNIGYGEWDWEILANEWSQADLEEWGLDVPEFAPEEEEEEKAEEDFYEIPEEIETLIKPGDLYQIGRHRLMCGDSTKREDIEKLMDGTRVDLVVTDPPYGVNYERKDGKKIKNANLEAKAFYEFLLKFFTEFTEKTKEGGAWYVWHAETQGASFRNAFAQGGLMLKQCLIWVKNGFTLGRQDYQWKHESCLYGWKSGASHYFTPDRTKQTVIEDQIDLKKLKKEEMLKLLEEIFSDKIPTTVIHADKPLRSAEHPTMKPILVLAPLIRNSSKRDWIVADPFLGSGSTMVACEQLNRICYGMELDPIYCQVIIDRMTAYNPEIQVRKIN